MSGIYIHGLEIPKDEAVGLFVYPNGKVHIWRKQSLVGQEVYAILVPDHGDLIDRDALDADLERQDMRTGEYDAVGFSIDEIENAPTIIPADKEI